MKSAALLSIGCLVCLLLIGGAQPATDTEAQAIRAALDAYLDTVRFPNPAPIDPELFAEDIFAYWSNGQQYRSREAVVDAQKKGVQEVADAFTTFEIKAENIRLERSGDLAWIACRLESRGQLAEDGRPFARTTRSTFIYQKRHGTWQMVHEHSSRIP